MDFATVPKVFALNENSKVSAMSLQPRRGKTAERKFTVSVVKLSCAMVAGSAAGGAHGQITESEEASCRAQDGAHEGRLPSPPSRSEASGRPVPALRVGPRLERGLVVARHSGRRRDVFVSYPEP